MLQKLRRKNRRAFTLTELAIVLSIIGVVLSAIWVAAGRANNSQKTEKAAAQIMQIIAGYRSFYAKYGLDTTGQVNVTCIGINAGFFPADMITPTIAASCTSSTSTPSPYPQGPWSGSTALVSTIKTYNALSPQYSGLSQNACIALASAIYNSSDMIYQAINNGTSWAAQWLPPYGTATPWTTSQIASYCGTGNNNTVQIAVNVR